MDQGRAAGLWSRRQFVQGVGVAGLGLVGLGLLAGWGRWPGQAGAPRIPHVGVLTTSLVPSVPGSLVHGLAERGYVDGQTIQLVVRASAGREDTLPALAAELVNVPVDVVVAAGEPLIRALQQATTTIPIVMATSRDPVGSGFVASLARPGSNITGFSLLEPPLVAKRLELLTQTLPSVTHVGVLGSPASLAQFADDLTHAGSLLGVRLRFLPVPDRAELEETFAQARRDRVEALLILLGGFFVAEPGPIAELAQAHGLPTIAPDSRFARAGCLLALGPDPVAMWRRAAYYVDRILKGAKPADLPIEQPTTFDFVINLRTARALGLTIPQHVLVQATEVIE